MCKRWFHADDIEQCPECGLELCPSCYECHVTKCTLQLNDEDYIEAEEDIPHTCPNCGGILQPDFNFDGSIDIFCDECGFSNSFNQKQIKDYK